MDDWRTESQLFFDSPMKILVSFAQMTRCTRTRQKEVVASFNTAMKACSISCANGKSRTSKSKTNLEWIILNIVGRSAHYVMFHMLNIVYSSITEGWKKAFSDHSPIEKEDFKDLRMLFAYFFFKYTTEKGVEKKSPSYLEDNM